MSSLPPAPAPLPAYTKPAVSFANQVAMLVQRGMVIPNPGLAAQTLSKISYYRISAYWHPFRQRDHTGQPTDQFLPGTMLDDALDIYRFDKSLRLLVMDALEHIEIGVRTAITYQLGMTYGSFAHEDASNFHPKFRHADWIAKLRQETSQSSDVFVSHFQTKYSGFPILPIWMATELLSMGSIVHLYKGMKNPDKSAVAQTFNVHRNRLENWLFVLAYVRNVCAHHSRLWNRQLAIKPQAMPEADWNTPALPATDRLFCILLMLNVLLRPLNASTPWRNNCNNLLQPILVNQIWRQAMGCPNNWLTHPYWL
jgi:abortive infection bacteriophage resistance protein